MCCLQRLSKKFFEGFGFEVLGVLGSLKRPGCKRVCVTGTKRVLARRGLQFKSVLRFEGVLVFGGARRSSQLGTLDPTRNKKLPYTQ